MSEKPFHFKEFTVGQEKCAMKIGTDGILLGAWAPIDHQPNTILDIGTGTGVIALMMAQRCPQAHLINALELDEDAYEQAVENFEKSDWGDRLFCYHADFEEFVEEMLEEEEPEYDFIISNPPFFTEEPFSEDLQRNKARFAEALPLPELLEGASNLLSLQGKFSLIIPYNQEEKLLEIAAKFHLYPHKITRVRGNAKSEIKRSLISLGFKRVDPEIDELILEISRHNYTPEYYKLVAPFYLKL